MSYVFKPIWQSAIIKQIEKYLALQGRPPLYDKSGGFCKGLSMLWGYWKAIGYSDNYFSILERLVDWDGRSETLKEHVELFDNFIREIRLMQFGVTSDGQVLQQDDFVAKFKLLLHKSLPEVTAIEFNMSFTFKEEEFSAVLEDVLKNAENKIISIQTDDLCSPRTRSEGSLGHAIGVSHSEGKYYFYDSNNKKGDIEYSSIQELAKQVIASLASDPKSPFAPINITVHGLKGQRPGVYKSPIEWVQTFIKERNPKEVNGASMIGTQISATPLHFAISRNDVVTADFLLKMGANISISIPKLGHALHHAILKNNREMILTILGYIEKMIREAKSDSLIKKIREVLFESRIQGFTTLQFVLEKENLRDTAAVMIKLGAKINAIGKGGYSVLCRAIHNKDKKLIDFLLANGVVINSSNLGETPALVSAIKVGDDDTVGRLLKMGADIHSVVKNHIDILHVAVNSGNEKIVKWLLEAGADVNEDFQNDYPLHIAVRNGNINMVKLLLSYQAKVNTKGERGKTPLLCVNNTTIAALLVTAGADFNGRNDSGETVFHTVENPDVIKYFIALGGNVKIQDKVRCRSPLHNISNIESASHLIEAGINVNEKDHEGNGPLHLVKSLKMAKFLIKNNADVTLRNKNKETPLHRAKSGEIAHCLIKSKAEVNAIDEQEKTPLHHAKTVEVAAELIEAGAALDAVDTQGQTPLLSAIIAGNSAVACLLLQKNSPIHVKDTQGKTPIEWAIERRDLPVIALLLKQKIDLEERDALGQTLVFAAIKTQNPAVLKMILQYNPNLEVNDNKGNTPLAFAEKISPYKSVVDSLTVLLRAAFKEQKSKPVTKEESKIIAVSFEQVKTAAHVAEEDKENTLLERKRMS